ncbi:hypothetical protein HS088_TW23G00950 [Tripterygium wilfordii]|uniref:FLZ-type domain-containing protein n=1 Tax=Tripterygium wilfordii TaxID=458696 RepID=A0A7J7BWE6_TRIWF|nr:FCS-Like Zinc finger 11-like [Tripterygium wilfordii]XP_038696465.1 FCS-Like Zinc finger 11-like [Tripterygium wilfordii]KAF5726209.1 hypothetical protein HS088_TW23G00950 [Tripterygium wilfordii]
MLRKRTRSEQKDQPMNQLAKSDSVSESYIQSDVCGHKQKNSTLLSIPGVFVGLTLRGLLDSDSVRSPTSPLEFRVLENLRNSIRSPSSPRYGQQKSWGSGKVGLSIIDSLDDDTKTSSKVLQSSESKNILFGQRVGVKIPDCQTQINSFEAAKSLPRNFAISPHTKNKSSTQKGNSDVLFEIGETLVEPDQFGKIQSSSWDSCWSFSARSTPKSGLGSFCLVEITNHVNSPPKLFGGASYSNKYSHTNLTLAPLSSGSGNGVSGSLSTSEIELSEDYTCVISHGPNPKKTHIFGDRILECHNNDLSNFGKNGEMETGLQRTDTGPKTASLFHSSDFLSFCFFCGKKLEEGKDVYIYRGEKAFCTLDCRSREIMMDEALEEDIYKSS